MKKANQYKFMLLAVCALGVLAFSTKSMAADTAAPKPDQMTNCPVSGEKLGGSMGQPYVFIYKGQEVKLCCKNCKKDFDKDPNKFIIKIRAADKPAKN